MSQDEADGAEPQDAAAEAFEALRAEVARLRAVLERLPTTTPDYSPTLAAIARSLSAMEAHPALRLTPDVIAAQVRQASEAARRQARGELASAVQRVDAAGAALERLAERLRTGREHVRQVAIMTAVGAVAGIILWVCFSGPIARALPAGWSAPERMAAATLRLDRREAGIRILRAADPALWNALAAGSRLEQDNAAALEGCRAAARRTGRPRQCVVTVQPPAAAATPHQGD